MLFFIIAAEGFLRVVLFLALFLGAALRFVAFFLAGLLAVLFVFFAFFAFLFFAMVFLQVNLIKHLMGLLFSPLDSKHPYQLFKFTFS
ncbi:MAG: hypothetical protein WA347_04980 [Rhabdochlamydiaceae bacterium]|jgi:hypothetical protein